MNLLQNLIHESLVATGHVECAAIIRRKDSSIRATSVGYTVRDVLAPDFNSSACIVNSQVQNKLKPSLRRLRTHHRLENMVSTLMELLTLVSEQTRTPSMLKRYIRGDFFGDDPDCMFGTDKNYYILGHVLFPYSYQTFSACFHFHFINVGKYIKGKKAMAMQDYVLDFNLAIHCVILNLFHTTMKFLNIKLW